MDIFIILQQKKFQLSPNNLKKIKSKSTHSKMLKLVLPQQNKEKLLAHRQPTKN